jgi:hypothetical protein
MHMLRVSARSATVTMALTLLSSLAPIQLPAQQEAGGSAVEPDAGVFTYAGGTVRGKRAKTQTTSFTFTESGTWLNLPGGNVAWSVPAGTSDLFNVSFSAECRLIGGIVPNDWVRIRVLDNGVPLEPYDGQQAFCSAAGYATYKGNWVRRVASGLHTIRVQFRIQDGAPFGALSAWIDDWTLELVVYN